MEVVRNVTFMSMNASVSLTKGIKSIFSNKTFMEFIPLYCISSQRMGKKKRKEKDCLVPSCPFVSTIVSEVFQLKKLYFSVSSEWGNSGYKLLIKIPQFFKLYSPWSHICLTQMWMLWFAFIFLKGKCDIDVLYCIVYLADVVYWRKPKWSLNVGVLCYFSAI